MGSQIDKGVGTRGGKIWVGIGGTEIKIRIKSKIKIGGIGSGFECLTVGGVGSIFVLHKILLLGCQRGRKSESNCRLFYSPNGEQKEYERGIISHSGILGEREGNQPHRIAFCG